MSARLFEDLLAPVGRARRTGRTWPVSLLVHTLALGALTLLSSPRRPELAEPARPAGPLTLQVVHAAERPVRTPPPATRARTRTQARAAQPTLAPALTETAPTTTPDGLPSADTATDVATLPFGDGCPQGNCVAGGIQGGALSETDGGSDGGPTARGPLVAGRDVTPPAKIHDVPPVYPVLAQRAGIAGIVVVACTIDPRGLVVDAHALTGPALLSEAALAAVRQWRYRPTLVGGQPVAVMLTVTVHFRPAGR